MDETIRKLVVLFADISGSTQLYERYGDIVARRDVGTCLDLLSRVVSEFDGKVVKTIGDEIMCTFNDPSSAARAADEMHIRIQKAGEAQCFESGPLRIKIGWHYGAVYRRDDDILGEAPLTAQQVIKLANPSETLTTGPSLAELPGELKEVARFIDSKKAVAWDGNVDVYALAWEKGVDATQIISSILVTSGIKHSRLVMVYGDREYEMGKENHCFRIGRADDNDLCLQSNRASRHHAEIIFRHDRFHLNDNSANGTVLIGADNRMTRLYREEMMLNGSGVICFGTATNVDPDVAVEFHCHE